MAIIKFKAKQRSQTLEDVADAAYVAAVKESDDAFSAWKSVGYRDYNPLLAWLVSKGVSAEDAEGALKAGFLAGLYWPEL